MVVWTIAYAWPRGAPWEGRPKEYAALLVEFLRRRRGDVDRNVKFVVAVHAEVPAGLVDLFVTAARPSPVHVVRCVGDPFLPTAQRIAPLLDPMPFTEGHEVVLADVHDGWQTQDTLLRKLRSADGPAAFTCWPAESSGNPACQCSLVARLPLESARPAEYHWHLDAGLATTTPAFRRKLHAMCGGFATYIGRFVVERHFERSVDEVAMETYVCGALPLLRTCAFHVHKSWPRSPRATIVPSFAPPAYRSSGAPIALEEEADHRDVEEKGWLRWAPAGRAGPRRARR